MSKFSVRVTLLLWLVLSLTAWNAVRVWSSLEWRDVLHEFSARPPVWMLALSGSLWTVSGFFILYGIWRGEFWTTRLVLATAATYSIWYWIERLVWNQPHANWAFALTANLLTLIFVWFAVKPLSKEAYERESEHQKDA